MSRRSRSRFSRGPTASRVRSSELVHARRVCHLATRLADSQPAHLGAMATQGRGNVAWNRARQSAVRRTITRSTRTTGSSTGSRAATAARARWPGTHRTRTSPGRPSGLVPGTALDAGCGAGAEAIWLASRGWQVTAADISSEALARAAERAAAAGGRPCVEWVEADLSVWEPGTRFDLVTTHYAHPAMPQLEFYDRIAEWVAPGGTLLIVGHLPPTAPRTAATGPRTATTLPPRRRSPPRPSRAAWTAPTWEIVTAEERHRTVTGTEDERPPSTTSSCAPDAAERTARVSAGAGARPQPVRPRTRERSRSDPPGRPAAAPPTRGWRARGRAERRTPRAH